MMSAPVEGEDLRGQVAPHGFLSPRQQSAEALREQSEWLRVTLSSIGDAVISTDAAGRVTFMNGVAESLTGWPLAEARGLPLPDVFRIVNERSRETVENPALRALREGRVVGLANHTLLIARDGTERPIDDSAAPMLDGDGAAIGAVLVFRDVTERKAAEVIQARLAAIVESSEDAIISKTLDGIIRSWNAGAERLFGHKAEEAIGRPITLIIPPERLEEEREILAKLRRGERIQHFETVRVTKDGRPIDISLSVSPLHDEEGHVVGASKVARDITGRKRAEDEKARLTETLRLSLDSADLGAWDWEAATDAMALSARAAEIFGIDPAGPHRREGLRELIHPDHRDRARREAARAVAERIDYDIEYPIANGRWVAVRGRGVFDPAGELVRMVGVAQDVTARKEAEAEARASEGRRRLLVDLAAATQPLTDPAAIMAEAARLLAEHLGADRCAYAEVEDESVYKIIGDHPRGVPSIVGRWPVASFGAEHLRAMRADQPFVVDDAEADPFIGPADLPAYRAAAIRAAICVPLRKHGKFTAAMSVHQSSPRRWTAEEVGLVTTFVGRCWEALERARTDRALRESEWRHRVLVNASSDVVYRMSADWAEMQPLDGRHLIPSNPTPIRDWMARNVPPEEHERLRAAIDAAIAGKRTFELEHRVKRVDGTIGWTFSRAVPILEGGEIVEWFGTARDVTDQRLAREELARVTAESDRLRRLYEAVLSATPDFVYVFSLDHRVLYANDALMTMWGRGPEETIGKTFLEIGYEPWHAEMHGREIDQVRATRRPIRGEVPFAGTHGRRVYDYIFVPVLGVDGEVEAVAGTTRDITESKEAERRKDEFIALLAHELRNPLAPLRNGLQLMRMAGDDAEAAAQARAMMERQLEHMVRLIDDLLDISRISLNKMELRRSRVLLSDVVKAAVETAGPAIEEAGHELIVSLPTRPVPLDADSTRLAQVFSNLLTNSAKYTARGGRIRLAAERRGDEVVVSVEDTGIGIPAEFLPRIFDMFSQVDRSIERSTGGLGIGLALVKGLVEMHGGTVAAESKGQGRGTTFIVRLPIPSAEPARAPAVAPREAGHPPVAGRRRILVVDDNKDSARSMARLLKLMGNETRQAYDGIEAVEVAERFRPDVILMDMGMPRLNGYEATRRIRSQDWGRSTFIIAMTGWGQDRDRARSKEAGCSGHLVKPVDFADLERLLADFPGPEGRGDAPAGG
ncbi:PAS domain S-box protein [Tundrisphaera sp. TA3]|uniref:PAS domain S-box protein n=1 Tax=Tundrisphaera sp. TA3 TaxID=3435775 RepID=UPI003EBE0555